MLLSLSHLGEKSQTNFHPANLTVKAVTGLVGSLDGQLMPIGAVPQFLEHWRRRCAFFYEPIEDLLDDYYLDFHSGGFFVAVLVIFRGMVHLLRVERGRVTAPQGLLHFRYRSQHRL